MTNLETSFDELTSGAAEAQTKLAEFRQAHASVLETLAEHGRGVAQAISTLAALLDGYRRCSEEHCQAAFERATTEQVVLPSKIFDRIESCDDSADGGMPSLPSGWSIGSYSCGCGTNGVLYCEQHHETDERRQCSSCAR